MMLTGDDYHFSHLIVGDGTATTEVGAQQVAGEYSDALLGAFAATAPAASAAVQALDAGDPAEARRILDAAEELSRHVFSAPTFYYKTGVAFLRSEERRVGKECRSVRWGAYLSTGAAGGESRARSSA